MEQKGKSAFMSFFSLIITDYAVPHPVIVIFVLQTPLQQKSEILNQLLAIWFYLFLPGVSKVLSELQ